VLKVAQVYDPASATWTAVASMTAARQFPVATRLPDGRVLVAGGRGVGDVPLSSAEIFDPATGDWSTTGSMAVGREIASGVTLPAGKVLATAGMGSAGPLASSELYDPATGTWSSTGAVSNARFGATATLLPDGSVLLAGGSAFTELYQPASGLWTRTGTQHSPRSFAATVAVPGGVLAMGGFVGTVGSPSSLPTATTDVESYDVATKLWTVDAALPAARAGASAALLGDGDVLAAGGLFDGASQNAAYLLTAPQGGSGSGGSGGGGSGGGDQPSGDQPPPDQSLPNTGVPADTGWLAFGALLSVLVGAVFLVVGRRRRLTD
jgi:LPXTG-motif cell wall-anchored protein